MPRIDPAYLEHQRKHWMRPDAYRFIRPDWRRFARPGFEDEHPFALYEGKYRPDQARVPPGSRDGGQWMDEEGGGGALPPNARPTQYRFGDETTGPSNASENDITGSDGGAVSDSFDEIMAMARQIAARGYSTGYLKCLDICYPLLERSQPPGADFNENAFRKCMNACLGRN